MELIYFKMDYNVGIRSVFLIYNFYYEGVTWPSGYLIWML